MTGGRFEPYAAVESDDGMSIRWPCGCAAVTVRVVRRGVAQNEMTVRACCGAHDDPLEDFVTATLEALAARGRIDMPEQTVLYPGEN